MLERQEVHPGIVVILPGVRRERQIELFTATLNAIREHDPPLDMINTVLERDQEGTVVMFPLLPVSRVRSYISRRTAAAQSRTRAAAP
ncbi:MAG TPA: hypothetical protein VHG08_19940 [Longimicrobium sp.]|nr:hypothetical protein [Longimicrobium sp.]